MTDSSWEPTARLVDLTGKVAVITGAGSGIGRACALRLADVGASVVVADIDQAGAVGTASILAERDARCITSTVDVRDDDACRRLAAEAVDTYARIDVVVNAAGIFPPDPLFDMTVEAWDRVLDINARGTFLVSRACAEHMGEGGAIVNIASKSAYVPTVGLIHYGASKGAVVMITKGLALELAPRRIRVNAVAPGAVDTPQASRAAHDFAESAGLVLSDIKAAHAERCPLGREADADDIARVVLFLATPLSSYLTGETVLADGGILLT
jgi:NAD(P)-dependent dehydrogenase (short-subunit alcohol dehydrogenase family)